MEFGRLKAYTARTRGRTSLEFKNLTDKPENAYLKQIPNVVAVGGGVPIKVGNEVIGAVGVSGAPGGEKDEACANAGIAKVAASLNWAELASRALSAKAKAIHDERGDSDQTVNNLTKSGRSSCWR
ncbi:MAG TPA: heme-binding protein [Xanthobacteraceae bacterium]|nr:heme-binding protein [Xanthobacteraceae bacterium]